WANGSLTATISTNLVIGRCPKPIAYTEVLINDINRGENIVNEPLILIETGNNFGFAGGNNVGLRFALAQNNFDYVWILNNDTVVCKDSLTELVNTMEADTSIGICGSKLMYYDTPIKVQSLGGKYNKVLGISNHIVDKNDSLNIDYVVGASMLVSKVFIETIGFMQEDYFLYYEDLDWSVRGKKFFKLAYNLNSVVYHKEGASTGGNTKDKDNKSKISDYYSIRNRVFFTKKYFKWYLPTVYLGLVLTIVNRVRRKQYSRVWMILKIILIGK
ncbi:MAG: glycosyltransferase family 2 protein, partial [Acidaminococcaceae bacterium]|nr:glycosyltransferase family 2 protein [Acidaminococcaceae bacterium]